MAKAGWGKATAKGGGASDPNILKLGDANKVRLLDEDGAEKWRQHGIQSPTDEEQYRSGVCPKGPDGRDAGTCPCCMKPSDEKGDQRFPVSRRFAANVWDYESQSVKVLIGGPQIFEEFDNVASVGINPTESDWIINKTGSGKQTKYKMVRADSQPLPVQVTPDMLHDLGKYSTPTSTEKFFEIFEELGIDYDSLSSPSYTVEQAEAFVFPYGKKHKGETLEAIYASDKEYLEYMHGAKLEQGTMDAVFAAIQTLLEHYGDVPPLATEAPTAPPAPAAQSTPAAQATPAATPAGTRTLVGPDGASVDVPEVAVAAMLAAGYTEPVAEPTNVGGTLVGLDGAEIDASTLPDAAVSAMLASGYSWKQAEQAVSTEPADDVRIMATLVGGASAAMLYGEFKALPEGVGLAWEVSALDEAPAEPVKVQLAPLPGPEDMVQVKLTVVPVPVPMPFKDYLALPEGSGKLTDATLEALIEAHAAESHAGDIRDSSRNGDVEKPVAEGVTTATETASTDPSLTEGPDSDGKFGHPALPKRYATKGAVTQALNRLSSSASSSAPAQPAAGAAVANESPALEGKAAKLDEAKGLLSQVSNVVGDFSKILDVFDEVAGKRNILEFEEADLDKLIPHLRGMLPAAA